MTRTSASGARGEMAFARLAEHFDRIEATSKRLEMTGLVVELLHEVPTALVDRVLYLLQGRVYPDFVGVELGVAEKLTLRAMAKTLGATEEEIDALRKKLGDIGLAAEEVLKRRRQRTFQAEPLTVSHVYETFERIAKATGAGSQEQKLRLLGELLHAASPLEGRYLVRLVTGKLRLGVADQTLLDALALFGTARQAQSVVDMAAEERADRTNARQVVERALDVTSDIALVAKTLMEGGLAAVERLKIQIGVPIRPMLAERTETLEEALERVGGRAQVEYKYDGLRVQAHVGAKVELFSRRLERITDQFPDLVQGMKDAAKGRDLIVEGEAVAIDPKTGRIRPFQDISTRRGRKYGLEAGAAEDYTKKVPVRLFLFDVLLADGKDVSGEPLEERRNILARRVRENERVMLAETHRFATALDLERYFEKVTTMGAEGIMIKDPRSVYKAGSRGWSWIKFKADYQAALADSFDLVVIGAYWGQGRRGGWYGGLLLASVNEATGRFESVTRLATGFDDATLAGLEQRFAKLVVPHKPNDVESDEVPDVWLSPETVVEIVGAEITLSPRHRAAWGRLRADSGLSIRFPRFTGRWRDDKKPSQATTSGEIVDLYERQRRKRSGGRG